MNSTLSSATSSPSLPLLAGFDSDKDSWDSPSLSTLPGSVKRAQQQRRWRPTTKINALLPLAAALFAVSSFAYLVFAFPDTRNAALDSIYDAVAPSAPAHRIAQWFKQPPPVPLDEGGIHVLLPTEEHMVTAIVLHGLGGTGDGAPFAGQLAHRFPFVKWVAPSADFMNVTVRGETTRAWFDISTFEDLSYHEDVAGYVHSTQQINKLVDEERQRLVSAGKEPRIVLMGFSQGGVMTLIQTLTASSPSRFEAAIVFSTYLPLFSQIEQLATPSASSTPLLWSHGRADEYLTFVEAQKGVNLLQESPKIAMKDVTFVSYEGMGHWWVQEELDHMSDWLAERVPAHRTRQPSDAFAATSTAPSLPAPTAPAAAKSRPVWHKAELKEAVEQVEEVDVKAELPARMRRMRRARK
ncbi:hypothetical protein JCM8547_001874 [Rhodosporidiobolus lusitaniae]